MERIEEVERRGDGEEGRGGERRGGVLPCIPRGSFSKSTLTVPAIA